MHNRILLGFAALMRSLSARILLGFAALTITFGIIVANLVWNLSQVEDQASLILRGYVPLALTSSELTRKQEDLKNFLEQGITDATRPGDVVQKIATLRTSRERALADIASTIEEFEPSEHGADSDPDAAQPTPFAADQPLVSDLQKSFDNVAPLYAVILATPPIHIPNRTDPSFDSIYAELDPAHKRAYDALEHLREEEHNISRQTVGLSQSFRRRIAISPPRPNVKAPAGSIFRLAANERIVRIRAIYLGITAVLLGLFITISVVITLRPLRRLNEGARRIAAGDYASRIPEKGPTEVRDLAREFNSMGDAVQQREEEKLRAARLAIIGKMAGQIAHEVRNPLSSIGLNTELLEDELGDDAAEARLLCRAIHNEVNRLTEVTEMYLGLRGGKPRLAKESLNSIIEDLAEFVRKDLAIKQVVLTTELAPDDPLANIDVNQIRQSLINLVRNAADAVAAQGSGHVILRTRRVDHRVEIDVVDDGIGIADDLLPQLFDPFFSTKEGGTGIGLAVTQQIIRDHGGELRVASTVGRGTTFTVSIPAA